jgi:hypothetical protein
MIFERIRTTRIPENGYLWIAQYFELFARLRRHLIFLSAVPASRIFLLSTHNNLMLHIITRHDLLNRENRIDAAPWRFRVFQILIVKLFNENNKNDQQGYSYSFN